MRTEPSWSYAQRRNFNIQQQFASDWLAEIGYAGARGTHLLQRFAGNYSPPGPGNINAKRQYRSIAIPGTDRVISPLGPVLRHQWSGNSTYNALVTKLEKRFSAGFTVLNSSYTRSKTLGDTCGFAGSGNAPACGYQDPGNLRAEKGLDNQHIAHRFVSSGVWELPWGRGRAWGANCGRVANFIGGGWNLSGIMTASTGRPFSVTTQGNPANIGSDSIVNRPNLMADPRADNRTLDRDFNVDAFVPNPQFTLGSAGRNILTDRGFVNLDFSVLKDFPVTERVRTQFRAEAFNLTNTPNFGTPGSTLGATNFGIISSAGRPRNLQFGLKIIF